MAIVLWRMLWIQRSYVNVMTAELMVTNPTKCSLFFWLGCVLYNLHNKIYMCIYNAPEFRIDFSPILFEVLQTRNSRTANTFE